MHYFDVVPLLNLPESKSILTYCSSLELQPGQLVEVKVRNRPVQAVVFQKRSKDKLAKTFGQIFPIEKILTPLPIVRDFQLKLFRWIADFYFVSLSKTFKVCLNLKIKKDCFPQKPPPFKKPQTFKKPSLILGSYLTRLTFYGQLIKSAQRAQGQALLIFPDLESLKEAEGFLGRFYGAQIEIYFQGLKNSLKNQVWQKALEAKPVIILATRIGLFLPCSHLGLLVIDSPTHLGQTETQSPTYQSLETAFEFQKLTGAHLAIGETNLSAKTLWLLQRKKIRILQDLKEKPAQFKIYQTPFREIFSLETEERLKEVVQEGESALVFINRKRGGVICQDCQQILTCPVCGRSLKFNQVNELVCTFCSFKATFQNCPRCQSFNLKELGISVSRAVKYFSKLFPKLSISVLTAEEPLNQKVDQSQLVISTKKILTTKSQNFQLGIVLGIDQMLSLPDFRAQEETYLTLSELSFFLPEVIIETKDINHPLLLAFLKKETKNWLKKELVLRQKYHLPPWERWIKITQKGKSEVLTRLEKKLTSTLKQTEFFKEVGRTRGKAFSSLSFTIPADQNQKELSGLLKETSSEARIEVDSLKSP